MLPALLMSIHGNYVLVNFVSLTLLLSNHLHTTTLENSCTSNHLPRALTFILLGDIFGCISPSSGRCLRKLFCYDEYWECKTEFNQCI
jgi:hypothetical protein